MKTMVMTRMVEWVSQTAGSLVSLLTTDASHLVSQVGRNLQERKGAWCIKGIDKIKELNPYLSSYV